MPKMLVKLLSYLLISLMLFSGCSSDYQLLQTKKTIKKEHLTAASIEYKILPQDRLKVVLYRDPGMITTDKAQKLGENINPEGILVNAAGYIKLPLIGKVKVAGLTQTQAADKIERLYAKQLTKPSVYVEIMNKRIVVLGEVKHPGIIKLDKEKMTLFEALGFAGGFTDNAVRNAVYVVSYIPGDGLRMRVINLTNFDKLDYASLMLRPNDIVYVKPDEWKKFKVASSNYVTPFDVISKVAAPFVTLKYLSE